jgi:hypothetical protein
MLHGKHGFDLFQTWNLRVMRWAMAVSHIVLVVSDSLMDPNLFQLMNSAEIIHSMVSFCT